MAQVLRIGDADEGLLAVVAGEAREAVRGGVPAAIRFARTLGDRSVLPGSGGTADSLSVLATVAAADLTVARVVEPHLDALAILDQAGEAPAAGGYGVYAAERPGLEPVRADGGTLTGTKPWCSLAGGLDRALITAVERGQRRLFDVDLHAEGVHAVPGMWVSRGLVAVDSGDLRLDGVPATPVGEAGWYLARPGFAWGGIGVAACWYGGAAGLATALIAAASRRTPDQIGLAAIGEADRLLWAARGALEGAAARIDRGRATGEAGALLAARVRGVVADAAERVLVLVGRALGPAPLTFDEDHARRVADLTVYLRQHHAERDDARAGEALLSAGGTWG
ncbi:acyl-CoA dehydrogenase [uncultured Amnibacterium sp.]|uniref:acyl-CoA dehydrogenase n=1 Tax=uncultured Amnibacterium sp. TaxID=1631851 RepID=UPI0035CB7498